jgi:hypothetical protein
MKRLLTELTAIRTLFLILSLVSIFHLSVITGIIPFEIVWGGRLSNHSEMLIFETVSIFINTIMLITVSIKGKYLKIHINSTLMKIIFWFMFVTFLLNTVGNIFSLNQFEKLFFTPLTLILSILSLRLAISNE